MAFEGATEEELIKGNRKRTGRLKLTGPAGLSWS